MRCGDEGYLFSVMCRTTERVDVITTQHFYCCNVVSISKQIHRAAMSDGASDLSNSVNDIHVPVKCERSNWTSANRFM